MFDVKRMNDVAARHPIEIRAAHSFSIPGNFNVDRRYPMHRNDGGIRTGQLDSGAEFVGAQYL